MNNLFKNKIVFITGAGSIGESILEQLHQYEVNSIRIFDNSEIKLHNLKQKYRCSDEDCKSFITLDEYELWLNYQKQYY